MPKGYETESIAVPPHSVPTSIFLHLVPGFMALVFHILIADAVGKLGWPIAFSWHVVTNIFCFLPIMFGVLLFEAKKRGNKGFSLEGVVMYRQTLSIRSCLFWALMILLLTAPIFLGLQPVTDYLSQFFTWIPKTDYNYEGDYPAAVVAITFGFNLLFTAIVAPIAEELYYRGYLLPRMPTVFGKSGPVVHSLLFSIHHPQSAWMVLVRTVGLLPLIYVTRHTRSLVPGVIAHCAVNTADAIEAAFARIK